MAIYELRDVSPTVWSAATQRAKQDGWDIAAVIKQLLDDYGANRITPTAGPPIDPFVARFNASLGPLILRLSKVVIGWDLLTDRDRGAMVSDAITDPRYDEYIPSKVSLPPDFDFTLLAKRFRAIEK